MSNIDPYAQVEVGEEVLAQLGLRLQTLLVRGQLPRAGVSPSLILTWKATDALSVSGALARSHQTPPLLYLVGLPLGPYVDLERSDTATLGVALASGWLQAGFDVWSRWSSDLAMLEADGSLGQLDGRAYGLEAGLRAAGASWSAQLTYGLSRTQLREESWLEYQPTLYDQPHRVLALGQALLPKGWLLGGRFRFSTGFSVPREIDAAFDLLTATEVPLYPHPRTRRVAPYHALDLRISKRFSWRGWTLDAYIDVQNVYNTRVTEPVINGVDETLLAYAIGTPILPLFGLEFSFWP